MSVVAHCEVERFQTVIARRLGLQFDNARGAHLATVLQSRLSRLAMPAEQYLREFAAGRLLSEPAALAEELTVGETYFFRNSEQFRAFVDVVLPARLRPGGDGRVTILSAGCASGEEAYSLAITLREALPDPDSQAEIRAVDLNPASLAKAARAHYLPWALRQTPADIRQRWFRHSGRELALSADARDFVHFEHCNLACDDAPIWQPQSFDVIFCRNVIMYFSADQARALLRRFARSLRPRGYLFLGHAETLRGFSDDFDLLQSHDTFYYQRKDDTSAALSPYPQQTTAFVPPVAAPAARPAVRQRVCAPAGRAELATALDLLGGERFAEALALLRRLPAPSADDPDVLLLTATLLSHRGQPSRAEEICRRVLSIDGRNAGAHYLLALCREAAGEAAGAVEHDRMAAFLDASFAMPRLHLGLLARRAGDRDAARREFGQALALLRGEDRLRLLMFGGGFGRADIISLCAAALRDCGGAP